MRKVSQTWVWYVPEVPKCADSLVQDPDDAGGLVCSRMQSVGVTVDIGKPVGDTAERLGTAYVVFPATSIRQHSTDMYVDFSNTVPEAAV